MITTWMMYCVAVSSLLAFTALASEHCLRRRGAALRWLWSGALLGCLTLSVIPWTQRASAIGSAGSAADESVSVAGSLLASASSVRWSPDAIALPGSFASDQVWPGRLLTVVWGMLSIAGILFLFGSQRNLRRQRKMWRRITEGGIDALVSRDTGPAVVGFVHPAIVIPEWVFAMDAEQRGLILMHEEEHLRAHDSLHLALALAALVLMPWNVPLWWQVRRLRHAIEMDCDARVIARCSDRRSYGRLLIEVGQRGSRLGVALGAFSGSSTSLEKRIRAMFVRNPKDWTMASSASGVVAALLFVFACAVPLPTMPDADTRPSVDAILADAAPVPSDTLVVKLDGGVLKLRIRTPDEEDVPEPAAAICSDPPGSDDEVGLIWPNCGGYKLYSDESVLLPKVHVVLGTMAIGGPAWRAGLRTGDIVLSVDGKDTRSLLRPFRGKGVSDPPYLVRVLRGAEELEIEYPVTNARG
jgi:hypothetical protein